MVVQQNLKKKWRKKLFFVEKFLQVFSLQIIFGAKVWARAIFATLSECFPYELA
jgi:hypothetical protein